MGELQVKTPWVIQIEATQAALTVALDALKFIKEWGECALGIEKRNAAIAQIEALGE